MEREGENVSLNKQDTVVNFFFFLEKGHLSRKQIGRIGKNKLMIVLKKIIKVKKKRLVHEWINNRFSKILEGEIELRPKMLVMLLKREREADNGQMKGEIRVK